MSHRKIVRLEVIFDDGGTAVLEGEDADRFTRRHWDAEVMMLHWILKPAPEETTDPVNTFGEDV